MDEWEERRRQRARSEEEVRAEAVDPDQIRPVEVREEDLPPVEERRAMLYDRAWKKPKRAGYPKPREEPKYKKRKLIAMSAPK